MKDVGTPKRQSRGAGFAARPSGTGSPCPCHPLPVRVVTLRRETATARPSPAPEPAKRGRLSPGTLRVDDGEIADAATRGKWEKLGYDSSVYGEDDPYACASTLRVELAAPDAASFGGRDDRQAPENFEASTLINVENPPAFAEGRLRGRLGVASSLSEASACPGTSAG